MVIQRENPNLIEGTNLCLIRVEKLSKSNTSGVRGMSPTRNGKWIAKSHFRESDIFLEHMQQLMKQKKQEKRRREIF